jgi:hypothetical protein
MKHLLWALPLLGLIACGDGKADAAKQLAEQRDSTAAPAVIDLSAHDVPLLLTPPDKQLTGGMDPTVAWKEEAGVLEVRAGDHFGMQITEEAGDLARLKADLDRDLLKKNTVISETPEMLIYRSEFPDDPSLMFIHFYQVRKVGDRTFVAQDVQDLRFNEQDVQRMAASLGTLPPA